MKIHETRVTASTAVLITSAFMTIAGCGRKHNEFSQSPKVADVKEAAKDGRNEILVPETKAVSDINSSVVIVPEDTPKKIVPNQVVVKSEDKEIRIANTDVGFKNFLQINATFSALTGVPTTQAKALVAFEATKSQLPSGNSIKNFSASVQVAATKLAAAYCDVALDNVTLREALVPGFNFAGNVATAFDAVGQAAMVDGFTASFWGDLATGVDNTASKATLLALLTDLKAGLETGPAAKTHAIGVGICAATLSSSSVLFL